MNELNELKARFNGYMELIDRDGKSELIKMLSDCNYFTAASSSKFHGSWIGGNLEHSLAVTNVLIKFYNSQSEYTINRESLIICGLFHDLGKSTYYGKPTYVTNYLKSGKISDASPYEKNKALLGIPHQIASIQMLSKHIELTEQESFAILFHNGLYTPDGREILGKEQPLQLLLHWADMWESRFIGKNAVID